MQRRKSDSTPRLAWQPVVMRPVAPLQVSVTARYISANITCSVTVWRHANWSGSRVNCMSAEFGSPEFGPLAANWRRAKRDQSLRIDEMLTSRGILFAWYLGRDGTSLAP